MIQAGAEQRDRVVRTNGFGRVNYDTVVVAEGDGLESRAAIAADMNGCFALHKGSAVLNGNLPRANREADFRFRHLLNVHRLQAGERDGAAAVSGYKYRHRTAAK